MIKSKMLYIFYKLGFLWRFRCSRCGKYIYDVFKTVGEVRLALHEDSCGGR